MHAEHKGEDWRSRLRDHSYLPNAADLARAAEPGRGRDALHPSQIPARGWRDIAWRVFLALGEDRILSTAGGVAFFALLAIFPGVATVVSLYGLFADTSTIVNHVGILSDILPPTVLQLFADQIALALKQSSTTLGTAFTIGLVIALWSANSGVVALFDALNVVYGESEQRSLLKLYATTFLFTVTAILFTILALTAVVVLPFVLGVFGLSSMAELIVSVLRWPILLAMLGIGLACLYRYGPSRRDARWRWVTWGSAVASLAWLATSMVFSWYVVSFDSYNRIYGSLGAAVGFMSWTWISVVVVLLGAEINAETEHQTARDTTDGPPRPLGTRGAFVADHVGESYPPGQDAVLTRGRLPKRRRNVRRPERRPPMWLHRMMRLGDGAEIEVEDRFAALYAAAGAPEGMMMLGRTRAGVADFYVSVPDAGLAETLEGFRPVSETSIPEDAHLLLGRGRDMELFRATHSR
ncbi:YihY/virulence factor BrkB family protein [Prosthecomicrobium sp. N25]|uniref:YihY/virulence factor BrkB family protein n=1 Tax=Prosthecomicrobium sp. N25 TaxID=3129254 RepID=UPI003077BC69